MRFLAALLAYTSVCTGWSPQSPQPSRKRTVRRASDAAWQDFWEDLAARPEIRDAWRRAPCVLKGIAPADALALDALTAAVDADPSTLDDAARVAHGATQGWTNVALDDAARPSRRLRASSSSASVLLNHGGVAFPSLLGGACRAALDAFEQPVGLNVYLTGDQVEKAAPAHTDRQEVFVVQCAGAKRWRVFAPPHPPLEPAADPFARGKGTDVLDERYLPCMLDVALGARDVLYVPAGFPHATATANTSSLHLTFGLAPTSNFGLSLDSLRIAARGRRTVYDPLDDPEMLREVAVDTYRELDAPLPLGRFLKDEDDFREACRRRLKEALAVDGPISTFRENLEDPSDDAIAAAADRVRTHHAALLDEMRRAYAPGDARPASARVADHIDRLGALVDALWNPQLERLRAKIAAATVVDRRNI